MEMLPVTFRAEKASKILAALKKHGLEKDTLVLFISDNGPFVFANHGGTRVPFLAWGANAGTENVRVARR